jgi:hypothetical protein
LLFHAAAATAAAERLIPHAGEERKGEKQLAAGLERIVSWKHPCMT